MRGGSIPLIIWGLLNLILLIIAAIWEGLRFHNGGLHVILTAFTVLVMFGTGAWLITRRRIAWHKGPPDYEARPEVLPRLSLAAAGFGVGVGLAGFGVVFGKWLIFFGGFFIVGSLMRLARELAWQHRTLRSVREERRL